MAWYDYKTQKYTLLKSKYWLESNENDISNKYWNLHFQGLVIELEDGKTHCLYLDCDCCNIQLCTFFSNNRMSLHQQCVVDVTGGLTYIYQRRK
jgi:hypothetical protein